MAHGYFSGKMKAQQVNLTPMWSVVTEKAGKATNGTSRTRRDSCICGALSVVMIIPLSFTVSHFLVPRTVFDVQIAASGLVLYMSGYPDSKFFEAWLTPYSAMVYNPTPSCQLKPSACSYCIDGGYMDLAANPPVFNNIVSIFTPAQL